MIRRVVVAAVAGLFAGGLLAGTAHADHNVPTVTVGEPGDCGTTTISTAWSIDKHKVGTAALVVVVGDDHYVESIGTPITVGPFDTATATIKYRVWGGGERSYDNPPLANLEELVAWLEEDDSRLPTDADAPGVAWNELVVKGCEQPGEPTDEPGDEPSEPAGEAGGDDEKPGLPATSGLTALPMLLGAGGLLVLAGVLSLTVARRRRQPADL